jgi:two-component system, OmpR family, phosphate regulon sensor histidine kinase PhoR
VPFIITRNHSTPEGFAGMRPKIHLPSKKNLQRQSISGIKDTIYLEQVRINPISEYAASLVGFNSFLFKQIAPQILFSVLLTVVTVIAFFVLYRSLRTQQRLIGLKNDFISNVSHELKTPVATVSVALEALKNFHALHDPKRTQEYLDIAQMELNRLTLMTDKILKSAVFESKGITLQQESVDLATITAQVLDSMKLIFEKNQAQTNFSTEGNDFTVNGSAAHLTNVVYNLIDNALKYSPVQPRLFVHLKNNPETVTLTIQDNGLGIAPEYKKRIFEKFFRIPTGDIHNIKGYGLGLSYVASVIEEHRGSIDVVSEAGKGSTFIIHLPKTHA